MFQAPGYASPVFVAVVIIDYIQSCLFSIADAFVAALEVFSFRKNVRIGIEYHWPNTLIYKAFYYCRRARGTAGVQKQTLAGHMKFQFLPCVLTHFSLCFFSANLTIIGDCAVFPLNVTLQSLD